MVLEQKTMASCPLVSILVPIYKVEKWLRKCIDSILGQTYPHLEIILVDDGSPDSCLSICDEYAAKDNRIKVFHKENGGLVSARKYGYEKATGTYLFWVDSDDWLRADTIEKMLNKAETEKCDIVWCDVQIVKPDKMDVCKLNFTENSDEMLHRLLEWKVPGWLCNKLVRTDYYASLQMHFAIGDDMFEDVYQSVQLLVGAPQMAYVPEAFYCYNRTNEGSYTAVSQELILKRGMPNILHVYDFLKKRGLFETYKVSFAYQAMRLKVAYLLSGEIDDARRIFSFAHKIYEAYPVYGVVRALFYMAFNCGVIGRWIAKIYLIFVKRE